MAVTQQRPSASASASPTPSHADQTELNESGHEGGGSNYIEKSTLLDIAFLHSIATHRPIGPHKHFNVIPILINLDRTSRQVGARIRDDVYMKEVTGEEEEGSAEGKNVTRRSIKRGDDDNNTSSSTNGDSSQSISIDSTMVWERLDQLYDVGGLEDLENQAIDNDIKSPFRHVHSYLQRRRLSTSLVSIPIPFGFGSGLEKKNKKAIKISNRSSTKRGAATSTIDDEEGSKDNQSGGGNDQVEFQLGPWDEFEPLIAPRRLKSYAPREEDEASESDEDLSEPSEAEDGQEEKADDVISEVEDVDGENDEEGDEAEGEEEEEEEEENDDDEEEEDNTSTTKRKAASKKQVASSKKVKKGGAAASSTAKSKATRKSAKQPRRSTRR